MKQEIAEKSGNFCGVCPIIGRLSELHRGVYRRGVVRAGFCRSFPWSRSDTHGIAGRKLTVPRNPRTLDTIFKEEHPTWQSKI